MLDLTLFLEILAGDWEVVLFALIVTGVLQFPMHLFIWMDSRPIKVVPPQDSQAFRDPLP